MKTSCLRVPIFSSSQHSAESGRACALSSLTKNRREDVDRTSQMAASPLSLLEKAFKGKKKPHTAAPGVVGAALAEGQPSLAGDLSA